MFRQLSFPLRGLLCFLVWLSSTSFAAAPDGARTVATASGSPSSAVSRQQALLLVSVDGFRPDSVIDADKHGLKLPFLRRLQAEGTHASGVRGAMPTATYPSHATLITGTVSARHGIVSNHPFGLEVEGIDPWYYYAEDLKAPTLWQVAAAAGMRVGSVSWPVTVGMEGIHYNIPEFALTRTDEDLKLTRGAATPGLFRELGAKAGPYITDNKNAVPRDWARTRYAIGIIREKKANFVSVHLAASDHYQHRNGLFAPKVNEALEEIDRMIADMAAAMRAEHPGAVVCVLSDHGFAQVHHACYLDQAFVKEGLITLKAKGASVEKAGVSRWVARQWSSGGSAAVTLKNPKDDAARARVGDLLRRLAANPANGIASILDEKQIRELGGAPEAAFWVDMKPGYYLHPSLDGKPADGTIAEAVSGRGAHGYLPTHADMDSTFIVAGPGIRKGGKLGRVDMRAIAPTLAKVMGTTMPSADLPPLEVFEAKR